MVWSLFANDRATRTIGAVRREFQRLAQTVENNEKPIKKFGKQLNDTLDGIDKKIGAPVDQMFKMASAASVAAGGMSALAAGTTQLLAAVGPAAGALAVYPTMMLAVKQSTMVAKFAIKDMDKAIAGDKEAMEKLSPAARSVAKEVGSLKKPFDSIRKSTQQAMFKGLSGDIGKLATAYLPLMRKASKQTATEMNGLAKQAMFLASSPTWKSDFATITKNNAKIIGGLGRAALNLAPALRDIWVSALPLTRTFVKWLQVASAAISRHVALARSSGALAKFFQRSGKVAATLGRIIGQLARALFNVFKIGAKDGQDLLKTLERSATAFRKWTETASGKSSIAKWFDQGNQTLAAFGRLLKDAGKQLSDGFSPTGLAPLIDQIRINLLPSIIKLFNTMSQTDTFTPMIAALSSIAEIASSSLSEGGALSAFARTLAILAGSAAYVVRTVPGATTALGLLVAAAGVKKAASMFGIAKGLGAIGKAAKNTAQFARGFASVSAGAADGASAATRLGSAVRMNVSIMARWIVTQVRAGVAATVSAAKTLFYRIVLSRFGIAVARAAMMLKAYISGLWASAKAAVASAIATVRARIATIAHAVATKAAALASKIWAAATWLVSIAMRAMPIFMVITAIALLVAGAIYAYKHFKIFRDVVNMAWAGIKIAALAAWNYGLKYVFDAIKIYVNIIIAYYKLLWTVAKLVWAGIWAAVKFAWTGIKPIWRAIQLYIDLLKLEFRLLWAGVKLYFNAIWTVIKIAWAGIKIIWAGIRAFLIGPLIKSFKDFAAGAKTAWNLLKSGLQSVYNSGIKPVFDRLKDVLNKTKDAFKVAVDAIARTWKRLEGAAKTPVNFVIGMYNDGIVNLVNGIARLAGIDQRLGRVNKFAYGGVMPGYSPGKDSMMAAVSPGEAIMRPEWTRAVGPAQINAMNAAARKRGPKGVRDWMSGGEGMAFASGGVVPGFAGGFDLGGIVGGFLNGAKKFAFDNIEKVAKATLGKVLGGAVPGQGMFRDLIAAIPMWIKNNIWGWFKDKVGQVGGKGMKAALNWAKTQDGKPYQWGGNGNPSWDCSGFMSAIESVVRGEKPHRRWATSSFNGGTPPGWESGKRSGFMIGVLDNGNAHASHTAGTLLGINVESSGSGGVRVGSGARGYNDGMFPGQYGFKADKGGVLVPGWNPPIYNGTRKPEIILTAKQMKNLIPPSAPAAMRNGNAKTFPWLDLGQGKAINRGNAATFPLIGKRRPDPAVKFPLIGRQIPDKPAPAKSSPGGGGSGNNNYYITVQIAPGGDLVAAGTAIVKCIREYERRNGRKWRTP